MSDDIKQTLAANDGRYELLTPNGWKDFQGIYKTEGDIEGIELEVEDYGKIVSTIDHEFMCDGKIKNAKDFLVGDSIDTKSGPKKILSTNDRQLNTVYDFYDVDEHIWYVNDGIISKQCDELGFVGRNFQEEFWTAITPTLSCVAGDTLVLSENGFTPIETYCADKNIGDYWEVDFDVYGKNGMENVSHCYVSPKSETLKIETLSGYMVEVTKDHPLYSLYKNKNKNKNNIPDMHKSNTLSVGDYVRIHMDMNIWGNNTSYCGVEVTTDEIYNIGYNFSKLENNITKIPQDILSMKKAYVSKFLSGYFTKNSSINRSEIKIIDDKKLLREIQLLLNNFGIFSSITPDDELVIQRHQYIEFDNMIGLGGERIDDLIDYYDDSEEFKKWRIPLVPLRSCIQGIVDESNISIVVFLSSGISLNQIMGDDNKDNGRSYITQEWLTKFFNIIKLHNNDVYEKYSYILDEYIGNFYYEFITSITESTNKTYDFTVPDTHSFIQNGILGSNTGGGCIITSTPNDDDDIFANIWRGANDRIDDNGNEMEVGRNGYAPLKVTWDQHPDRGEEFAKEQIATLGIEKFEREFNCEFISESETLIDQMLLGRMQGIEPIYRMGQIRWYNYPESNKTIIVGLDPSLGTGGDPSAIQVFQLPEMKQICEWVDNKTPTRQQIQILLHILTVIQQHMKRQGDQVGEPEIYWSVENNAVGEAAMVIIEDSGEENFPGELINEPKKKGKGRARRGLTTTNKSKLEACAKLKSLVDTERLKPLSKALVSELKTFVPKGGSYAAKPGCKDDIVMATVICIRILLVLQSWDEIGDELKDTVALGDDAALDDPMPMLF